MKPAELARLVERSLQELDLTARVSASLPRPPSRGARLVAIGKAAPAMAAGAFERWGDAIVEGVLVSPHEDVFLGRAWSSVDVLCAGHPLPNRQSVRAAARVLAVARSSATDGRLLLVLVSGGASALTCSPAAGLTLRDKQRVTRAMLASGASIQEINVVRKHLSTIKGGGLARAAAPAPVMTLVASDVIGGAAADVGSGPSVTDSSTVAAARRLLRRYTATRRDASWFAELPLVRTGKAPNATQARLIASPEELARIVGDALRASGVRALVLPPSQAAASELAREYIELARGLVARPPGIAIVRAAEPAVAVAAPGGRGGRSTHLATLVGASLPPGAVFMAVATDGDDGTSRTAGAIVDGSFAIKAGARAIESALARFDTGRLHRLVGTALPHRPTGHNLADLHVLVR